VTFKLQPLIELNGGALGFIPDSVWAGLQSQIPSELRQIYAAERELRNLLNDANYTYESLEEIAVLAGIAPAEYLIRDVPRGRWAEHPDGYFVRYFPNGYQSTRVEVLVPPTNQIAQEVTASQEFVPPINHASFDLSSIVATPANTSAQRIGIGTPEDGAWYEDLPDCPCSTAQSLPLYPGGSWGTVHELPDESKLEYHPGGTLQLRWTRDGFGSGQQCIFDAAGVLINQGLAAGTADRQSFPDVVIEDLVDYVDYLSDESIIHFLLDVVPFSTLREIFPDDFLARYHKLRPPNQGADESGRTCSPYSGPDISLSEDEQAYQAIDRAIGLCVNAITEARTLAANAEEEKRLVRNVIETEQACRLLQN
jgi:hypothetical protein